MVERNVLEKGGEPRRYLDLAFNQGSTRSTKQKLSVRRGTSIYFVHHTTDRVTKLLDHVLVSW
jgi:hypothetical protein